jgi:hypothetical protein
MNLSPAGYRYRPLTQGATGHDVLALQFALGAVPDGAFGPKTRERVVAFQRRHFPDPDHDGIAGIKTQRELCLQAIWPAQRAYDLPPGLARGMVEGESGFMLGNHTPRYSNGRFDVGPVQFNVDPADSGAVRRALNVPDAIGRLCDDGDRGLRGRHDRYYGQPGAQTDEEAWKLAVMSWNAPSWADTWARKGAAAMSQAQRDWMLRYLAGKIVYVQNWRDPRGLA